MSEQSISSRLFALRGRRGMTQEELAEAAGLHVNVIKKIEAGGSARMETYHAIARVLGVVTMTFVPPPMAAPEPVEAHDERDVVLADMRAAIVPPVGLNGPVYRETVDEGAPDLDRLGRAAASLVAAYHGGRYDDVAQIAPGLIRSAHFHVGAVAEQRRRDAVRLRGDVLGVTGRYLVQIRAHDLALVALQDALRDATEVGDQALAAMTISGQAWAMLRQARFTEVERLCSSVADALEPRVSGATADQLASWGWMLLRASAAASRNNRSEEAREYLSVASAAAARLGTEHYGRTGHESFGPLAAAIQGTENELIGGHPDKALELAAVMPRNAGDTNPAKFHRHLLDCARAHLQTGAAEQATEVLLSLRQQDPGWLRHQRLARDIVRDLLKGRKRVPTEEQRQLADFMMVEV